MLLSGTTICDLFECLSNKSQIDDSENKISLCAKDIEQHWKDWITLNLATKDVTLSGNTDNCNFWFCDTRKDMTPDRIIEFVADINTMLRKFNKSYRGVKRHKFSNRFIKYK